MLSLIPFQTTLTSLEKISTETSLPNDIIIDASMRRFKLTIKICIMTLRAFFKKNGIKIRKSQNIITEATKADLIKDLDFWLTMFTNYRNIKKNYDDKVAQEIFINLSTYIPELRNVFNQIKTKLLPKLKLLTDENL